jgi:hypothetical protein
VYTYRILTAACLVPHPHCGTLKYAYCHKLAAVCVLTYGYCRKLATVRVLTDTYCRVLVLTSSLTVMRRFQEVLRRSLCRVLDSGLGHVLDYITSHALIRILNDVMGCILDRVLNHALRLRTDVWICESCLMSHRCRLRPYLMCFT